MCYLNSSLKTPCFEFVTKRRERIQPLKENNHQSDFKTMSQGDVTKRNGVISRQIKRLRQCRHVVVIVVIVVVVVVVVVVVIVVVVFLTFVTVFPAKPFGTHAAIIIDKVPACPSIMAWKA